MASVAPVVVLPPTIDRSLVLAPVEPEPLSHRPTTCLPSPEGRRSRMPGEGDRRPDPRRRRSAAAAAAAGPSPPSPSAFGAATMQLYGVCRVIALLLCSVGIFVSVYAYYVETKREADRDYRAACDVSDWISCSKVFTSRYGRGFGLLEYLVGKEHWINQPNSVFGVFFYILHIILGQMQKQRTAMIQVSMSVVANIGSVYLACILYFVLHDFCVVCFTIYVINFLILLCNITSWRHLSSFLRQKSRSGQRVKPKKS